MKTFNSLRFAAAVFFSFSMEVQAINEYTTIGIYLKSVFKDYCWATIYIANAPKPATCGNSGVLPGGGWIANKRCGYVMGTPDAFDNRAGILTRSRNCCRWSEIRCRIYGQHGLSLWEVPRYRRKLLHVPHSFREHFHTYANWLAEHLWIISHDTSSPSI